jgi:hypothetical protein
MTSPTILCPACGYELGAAPQVQACPECGHRFHTGVLDARRHAETSLALGLIAAGALGTAGCTAIGNSFAFLPRASEGQAGAGTEAAHVLSLLAVLGMCYGVAALASLTASTPAARRWPIIAACVLVVSAVLRVTTWPGWGSLDLSRMFQPWGYAIISSWTITLAEGALIATAALMLRRVITPVGSARLRRAAAVVALLGVVVAVLSLATRLHAELAYPGFHGTNPFGGATGPKRALVLTNNFTPTLEFVRNAVWWLAMGGLGFVALHVRTLWKVSREGR